MSLFTFAMVVLVGGYGLRIAYGLMNSLNSGFVRLKRRGGETIISREEDPRRFWSVWLMGATLVAIAVAYLARQVGMI